MKTLGVFIGLLFLCSFGLSIGGLLWEGGQIPVWLISPFLLPAALLLDYSAKGEKYPSKIRKYSTTLGVLCMTLTGYLLLDYLGLKIEIAFAIVFFLLILIFAPKALLLWIYVPFN